MMWLLMGRATTIIGRAWAVPVKSMVDESPGYLAHSVALLRAASQVPRARWVVLLREPVERALSHFMHLPRKQGGGQGSLKGFMEAD